MRRFIIIRGFDFFFCVFVFLGVFINNNFLKFWSCFFLFLLLLLLLLFLFFFIVFVGLGRRKGRNVFM